MRALLDAQDGIDVFETADSLHVSPATLDADLARVRGLLGGTELTLERSASRARLRGTEMAQRRLLSRLAHDEMDAGSFDLDALRRTLGEGSVGAAAFGPFKTDLVAELGTLGYFVNEIGIADVVMHIAIAADRVAQDRGLESGAVDARPAQQEVAAIIARSLDATSGIDLGHGRPAAPRDTRAHARRRSRQRGTVDHARSRLDPEVEAAVREVVETAAAEFLVDIVYEDFILRLALHVQNLQHRAREQAWSRNPLTRSLKSTYPMIFEVAVFIASRLQERLGIPLPDDEIAYIAMHVGGRLERSRRADQLLTATIVCPGYYDLHELLRSSVDRSLGQAIEVVGVETRVDPGLGARSTPTWCSRRSTPPIPGDRIVKIQPFLTGSDIERVQAAAGRIRRARRLARLRNELERYFDARVHLRPRPPRGARMPTAAARSASSVTWVAPGRERRDRRRLRGARHPARAAVVDGLHGRPRRAARAGDDRHPHRHRDRHRRPVDPVGRRRVQVVALVAFSETDREAFQTVFEQFVEVFSERDSVQRIVRRSTDFGGFLDELVAVIDG